MRYHNTFIACILLLLVGCQSSRFTTVDYDHPIPFEPEHYICYQTPQPLIIDGKLDEAAWEKSVPTKDFQDIQGNLKPQPQFKTYTKMLWDKDYFYFGAYMEEPHIWAKLTQRDAVIFHDNDFEIFIDPDGDSHYYYEFEMNALNTVWDLLLMRPYREDRNPKVLNNWRIKGLKTAVDIQGSINDPSNIDSSWTVEIAIPWKVLREMIPKSMKPKSGVQWNVNFSRVNWQVDIFDGKYQKRKNQKGKKLREENWVWSPQGYINMHAPETWGIVQFSEHEVGTQRDDFIKNDDFQIKWALRQLYYQQKRFYKRHKIFTDQLKYLTIPNVNIPNYTFEPQIKLTFTGYEIRAKSTEKDYFWVIQEDGKIFKYREKK